MPHSLVKIMSLLLLLQGCSALTDSDTEWETTDFTDEGITLSLVEYYSPHPNVGNVQFDPNNPLDFEQIPRPQPALKINADTQYGCANYGLKFYHGWSEDQFDVQLVGVDPPEICLYYFQTIGYSSALVPLPERTGSWNLSIWSESEEDRYRLRIFDDHVELETIEADYSELQESRYYLRPENSIYLHCATKESTLKACETFKSWLEEQLFLDPHQFPTDGVNSYFPSNSSGNARVMNRFYTHPENISFSEIRTRLETYIQENDWDEMTSWIRIYNWEYNRVFSSEFME
ncbi:MAG: hypothetical protein WEA36_06945 [Balneolaceae bacterium]